MHRILIVVDCQKDFIDGTLGFDGAKNIIPGIIERIESYRAAGDEIIYTLDTHGADYLDTQEGRYLPVVHCVKGSSGFELDDSLKPYLDGCHFFEKPTFGSLELAEYLSGISEELSSIELCGLVSNICVISNAMLAKAAAPEALIIVDKALTASFDAKLNEAALDVLGAVQVKVQ